VAIMARFVSEYGKTTEPAQADGRLDAPAFHRNHEPIWSAVGGFLATQSGDLLEIGSGTGQHAAAFAPRAPGITWWPSDIYDSHLKSIAAWRTYSGVANLRPPQRIDLSDPDWSWTGDADRNALLTAMLCINVLHISSWRVSKNLFAGAGRFLRKHGRLFVCGPFRRDGAHTSPSNAAFDASLRAENPEWGVRDLSDLNGLAKSAGLTEAEISPMPANNLVLAFARALGQN
jgi:SAM-dependent methyltransferase